MPAVLLGAGSKLTLPIGTRESWWAVVLYASSLGGHLHQESKKGADARSGWQRQPPSHQGQSFVVI